MFLIIYLLVCSILNASLKENLNYLKNKKIISENLYKELNEKENVSKEVLIEALSKIIKTLEERKEKDPEDMKIVKNLITSISPEVIKNSIAISECISRLEKLEKEADQDIKKRLNYLENIKKSLNFGFKTKLTQNIDLIQRYEESNFIPPIFIFKKPFLDFELIINSNLVDGLNLKTDLAVENNFLKIKNFEIDLKKDFISLSLFKNKEELPSLMDLLRIYYSQEFLLENGLLANINIYRSETFSSSFSFMGGANDSPLEDYLYYAKLKNNLNLGNKNNKVNPFLNFYYIEKGTNDKKFKGFMILEAGMDISNDIFKTFDFNLEYSKLIGNDFTEDLINSEFMKSISVFKLENRDALYLYSKIQLNSLKLIKLSFGLFESGKIFDTTILGDRYQDPSSKLLIAKKRLVFKESDIIEYQTGAGLVGRISLGEDYNYSLGLTYSYSDDSIETLNKLAFDSVLRLLPFNIYSNVSLYNIKEPLIKVEEFFTLSNTFDLETKFLFTKDTSIEMKDDNLFSLGLSGDIFIPINIHNLLLGVTYLNKGLLIDKENDLEGKSTLSALIGYENYDISSWMSKTYFNEVSLKVALSYLYNLNKNVLGSLHEFQFSISSNITDLLVDRLSLKPAFSLSNKDNKWYPGLNLSLNYLVSNNCNLVTSLGNMSEMENDYFIDRKEKMKINLPLNRLSYDFKPLSVKVEVELKI